MNGRRPRIERQARTLLVAAGLMLPTCAAPLRVAAAQHSAPAATSNSIEGTWQGTLHAQKDLRLVLKVTKAKDGSLHSVFYSIDERGQPIPVETTTVNGTAVTMNMDDMDGAFVGNVAPDNTTITGEWPQSNKPLPLILVRVTADTAWTVPEPPPRIQAMDPKANPSFEVATIKLSDPNSQGKGFGGPPGKFMTHNTTLNDLLMFAYQVQIKQIIDAPGWAESEKFDIVGKQDTPGQASEAQMRTMMQKLLVSRFGLKFHMDKKELPAFILSVSKSGPKLKTSTTDPSTPSTFLFRQLGDLTFRNISMEGFSKWMQTVLDRPVVNHTDLPGHFDGKLKWNPDETQFAVFGVKVTPSDAPDAPPDLYKAIQEQIGLRLDAGKPNVDVLVIDHVEKPSEN